MKKILFWICLVGQAIHLVPLIFIAIVREPFSILLNSMWASESSLFGTHYTVSVIMWVHYLFCCALFILAYRLKGFKGNILKICA